MTYQLLLSRLEEIITSHKFIFEYGYGNISDIAKPDDEKAPDYPYAFINPVQTTLNPQSFSATFNLIVMTQVLDSEDDEIFGQSNCMKYINDVLSQFVMTNNDPLLAVSFPVNMTPFKERFQDDVVGATAQVTVTYGKGMSVCDSPISAISPSTPYCPQVLVIDGDESQHYLDAGETYSCLPATAKSGILYQRVIPWDNNLTNTPPDYSVDWHKAQGTYRYNPPVNPLYIALLADTYAGTDADCLLAQPNSFGNYFRYTNDRGQQYTENFNNSGDNKSDNPQYCIDHYTGLGIFVDNAYVFENLTWVQALDNANSFSYAGFRDYRLADVNEFLNIFNLNDWNNAWPTAYTPWMDPDVRNYGARYWFGSRDRDAAFQFTQTNGSTVGATTSPTVTCPSSLKVRNHFI